MKFVICNGATFQMRKKYFKEFTKSLVVNGNILETFKIFINTNVVKKSNLILHN